ncbi:hypothetical protein B0O99DRAFT_71552 [Bisporella sp. PMI_857]|nr:hypothetical protein B0O99DRAFT_71552 [Bisporella sp. PMI_857]
MALEGAVYTRPYEQCTMSYRPRRQFHAYHASLLSAYPPRVSSCENAYNNPETQSLLPMR